MLSILNRNTVSQSSHLQDYLNNKEHFIPGRRSAFTMVELLVVIAIIAILAAILFPVFAQARDKARQTACLANLKQLGTAMRMYMDDFDGCGPDPGNKSAGLYGQLGASGFRAASDPRSLPAILDPYIKSRTVWWCPNATFGPDELEENRNTYIYNINTNLADGSADSEDTTKFFIFFDNFVYSYYSPKFFLGQPNSRFPKNNFPHAGGWGYNAVYVDSHTKIFNIRKPQ